MSPAPPSPYPSLAARTRRLGRLARKELSETLRDRRTLLTLVLMPLLLYPLMGLAVLQFHRGSPGTEAGPRYRLAFSSDDEATSVRDYLRMGEAILAGEGVFVDRSQAAPSYPLPPAALALPVLEYFVGDGVEDKVLQGSVDVGLRTRPPGPFSVRVDRLAVDLDLVYREDSVEGREAVRHVQRLCEAANGRFLGDRLHAVEVRQRPVPVQVSATALRSPDVRKDSAFLTLLPLILILMTITGAVYPAIDLTAGERERGTLEILMAAPLPRLSLLLAKYAAVLSVAMLTALVNLGSMAVTLAATGLGTRLFGTGGLSPLLFVEVFGLLLLFAAFFSAVLLGLTSFARSFKEAQAYLIPLMLLALLPGMLSLVPNLPLAGPLLLVPLLNVVLLSRDLLAGKAEPLAAAVVVVSTLAYALGAIAVAARLFGAEAVRGGQGGWFAWLRRRRE